MRIYADNAATTALSDTALAAMMPCFQEIFANPSSLHTPGQQAAESSLPPGRSLPLGWEHSPGRSPSPLAAVNRTCRLCVLERFWGPGKESGISSPPSLSTTLCSIPWRPWRRKGMR